MKNVVLRWQRFETLTEARDVFASQPCVYVQADRNSVAVRVGKASKGLQTRYRGGTGHALDAAMHRSGNKVFATSVPAGMCDDVERSLIWQFRASLPYNIQGKRYPPARRLRLAHRGTKPHF